MHTYIITPWCVHNQSSEFSERESVCMWILLSASDCAFLAACRAPALNVSNISVSVCWNLYIKWPSIHNTKPLRVARLLFTVISYTVRCTPLAGNTSPLLRGWSGVCLSVSGWNVACPVSIAAIAMTAMMMMVPACVVIECGCTTAGTLVARELRVDAERETAPNNAENVSRRACITGTTISLFTGNRWS